LVGVTRPAVGTVVPQVFRVDLPVSRLAAGVPEAEIRRAARVLLDRITGDPDLAARGSVNGLLAESSQWVAEYGYKKMPGRLKGRGDTSRSPFRLWIRFGHRAVERAVLGAHLPFWGELRPLLLVWLDAGSQSREILSASSPSPLRRHLERTLHRLALPALLPVMDLRERLQIRGGSLSPPAWPLLRKVSKKYRPEALWVGRLTGSPAGGWLGVFALRIGHFTLDWKSQRPHVHRQNALQSAVDHLDSILASRYAVFAEHEPVRLSIRIRGRLTLRRISRLEHFFRHLPGVTQAHLRELASKSLTFTVLSRIDRTHLRRLMALAGPGITLKPETEHGHRLVFALQP
jgi:hypothetical protein